MKRFGAVVVMALLTGVGLAAPARAQTPSPSPTERTVTVTRADKGSLVWLRRGDRLVVSLTPPERGVWLAPRVTSTNRPGLFREALHIDSAGASATFRALSNSRQWVETENDAACLHADPPCDFNRDTWRVEVVVSDTEPTPTPRPMEAPPSPFFTPGGPVPPASGRTVTRTDFTNDDVVHLQAGDRLVIDVPGHHTDPVGYPRDGLFRESVDIGANRTRATFFAVSDTVSQIVFHGDAACFYTDPMCLMASMQRQLSVIVGCGRTLRTDPGVVVDPAFVVELDAQPRIVRAGAATAVGGKVRAVFGQFNPDGERVALLVRLAEATQCTLLTVARANATGDYGVRQAPLINRRYRAVLVGSPYSHIPQVDVGVRTALTRIAPANGAVVPQGTPLAVRGVARPGFAGTQVHLQERTGTSRRLVATTTMGSDGSFTLSLVLPPGRHVLQIITRENPRNLAGASTEFAVSVS